MWRFLRSCAHCRSQWPPIDFFCRSCWEQLSSYSSEPKPLEVNAPFPVRCLWRWKEEPLLRSLVYGQKRHPFLEFRRNCNQKILALDEDLWGRNAPQAIAYVYNPDHPQDHAHFLARDLAEQLKIPTLDLPLKTSVVSYKQLGRRGRSVERQLSASPGARRFRRILFVDDVYTTGTTALKAWEALGKPKGMKVWVWVYKEKSKLALG